MTPTCPSCDRPLEGLARYCERCHGYVVDLASKRPTPRKALDDKRSEAKRKADARPAVEALGWRIHDTEQGYRPKECACGRKIPGGGSTRVPLGFPDWVVQGYGIIAYVEWKTEANDQTEPQRIFEAQCKADGVPYCVVRNTKECVDYLESLKHRGMVA